MLIEFLFRFTIWRQNLIETTDFISTKNSAQKIFIKKFWFTQMQNLVSY